MDRRDRKRNTSVIRSSLVDFARPRPTEASNLSPLDGSVAQVGPNVSVYCRGASGGSTVISRSNRTSHLSATPSWCTRTEKPVAGGVPGLPRGRRESVRLGLLGSDPRFGRFGPRRHDSPSG